MPIQIHPRFHPERLNAMLHRHGVAVSWEAALLCQCWGKSDGVVLNYETNEPDPMCPTCFGEGYVWAPPQVLTGIVLQTLTPEMTFSIVGQVEDGDLVATVPSDVAAYRRAALGDRIVVLDVTYTQFEHVIRGRDTVRDFPVAIDIVQYGDVIYRPGLDYQLVGQTLTWVGNAPPMGETYGVRFQAHPTYQMWLRLPQPRIIDTARLPDHWWLVYRQQFARRLREAAVNAE